MIEPKVLKNAFSWTPKHLHQGPLQPPRKADHRKPLLWLTRDGVELYLVNDSGETLEYVHASSGGYQTVDDQSLPVGSAKGYSYDQVQPGEAVKVDEFDEIFDSDFVLAVYVEVHSAKLGHLTLASPAEKGGVCEAVLLWDRDTPGESRQ